MSVSSNLYCLHADCPACNRKYHCHLGPPLFPIEINRSLAEELAENYRKTYPPCDNCGTTLVVKVFDGHN